MSTDNMSVTPKNIYLAFLIKHLDKANEYIYERGQETAGLRILLGIINSLHENSKADSKVKEVKKELENYFIRADARPGDGNRLYDLVSTFLMEHYLTETNLGLISPSALETTEKKPEHKAAKAFLPAGL